MNSDQTPRFPGRIIWKAASGIGLMLFLWWAGLLNLSPSKRFDPSAKQPPEPSWEAQIKSVQRGETDRIEVTKEVVDDKQLEQLTGLTGLRELLIEKGDITAAGLEPLAKLSGLEHLRIRGARIDNEAFERICSINSLQRLNLPQADLTDEGLTAVTNLNQLQLLRLGSPRLTDAGIASIGRVQTLRWLHLIDIPLSAASLKSIAELKNLESLYLDGAKLSDEAYEAFFRMRPDLHVHIDQQHHDRDPHKAGHSH
jgi:Leucine-rich repeat (LRR) protein